MWFILKGKFFYFNEAMRIGYYSACLKRNIL